MANKKKQSYEQQVVEYEKTRKHLAWHSQKVRNEQKNTQIDTRVQTYAKNVIDSLTQLLAFIPGFILCSITELLDYVVDQKIKSTDEAKLKQLFVKFLMQKNGLKPYKISQTMLKGLTQNDPDNFKIAMYTMLGKSLHKEKLLPFLTKKETHYLINCNYDMSIRQAIVYSIAKSELTGLASQSCKPPKPTEIEGLCKYLATTNLSGQDFKHSSLYWVKVVRTMARMLYEFSTLTDEKIKLSFNAETGFMEETVIVLKKKLPGLAEINDVIDYMESLFARVRLNVARQVAEPIVIDHRLWGANTYHQLELRSIEWHRAQTKAKEMGDFHWEGVPLDDESFIEEDPKNKGYGTKWDFVQILKSKKLLEEGQSMRHCVFGYKQKCLDGTASIWSVKKSMVFLHGENENSADNNHTEVTLAKRCLTVEINTSSMRIIQVRGVANRVADSAERALIRKWANKNGLDASHYY